MKHTMTVSIDKDGTHDGIVSCKEVSLRERLLRKILGKKEQVTILVPGRSVETVAITEIKEEEPDETV